MIYNKNFDVDTVLRTVETVNGRFTEGSEDESLRICAAALLFVRDDLQKLEEFREFFRKISTPAAEGVKVAHSFATMSEAEEWLRGGTATDGQLVRIASQGFLVIDHGSKGLKFVRIPLPEELEPQRRK